MRKVFVVLGLIVGVFLIVRVIVELLVIDDSDQSSDANDWGGPSLPGVLLVHAGPGVLAALAIGAAWRQSAKPSALTGEAELGSAKVRASASRAAPGDTGARPMRRAEGRCRRAVRLCGDVADGVTRPATGWPSTCASTTKRTQHHPCQGTDDHRCIPGEAFQLDVGRLSEPELARRLRELAHER
jgi:hypothetical protein